jgi:hypothetical protein
MKFRSIGVNMILNHVFRISIVIAAFSIPLAHAAEDEKWSPLFDGKTLDGWVKRGGDAPYHVEDGCIVGRTVPGGNIVDGKARPGTPNTFLCTEKHFSDFILELEFKVDEGMNSGVQIRSNSFPDHKNGRVHGYQVEIDTRDRAWSGGIFDEARRGWLYNLEEKEEARKAFKQNEWNHFRIEARGSSIRTWINGVAAANLMDSMTPSGFIGLQVHGSKKPATHEVRWRNIRMIELDSADVTN